MEQTVHLPLDREQHIKGNFLFVFVSRESTFQPLYYMVHIWLMERENLTIQETQY